jgi:hypothetical protein
MSGLDRGDARAEIRADVSDTLDAWRVATEADEASRAG